MHILLLRSGSGLLAAHDCVGSPRALLAVLRARREILSSSPEDRRRHIGVNRTLTDYGTDLLQSVLAGAATAAILGSVYLPIQNRLKMRSRISSV